MRHNIGNEGRSKKRNSIIMKDVIIIGAGPAGMTAALYTATAGLSTTLLEKSMYGGQLIGTSKVENYPGVGNVTGYDLAGRMHSQLESIGVAVTADEAMSIERFGDEYRVVGINGEYRALSVIIANGAARRLLGCRGESKLAGRGVSYCAVCDGMFFRGRPVCVVGGGKSAVEEALYLSGVCSHVWLIHRRGDLNADERYLRAVEVCPDITVMFHHTVEEILGDDKVRGVKVKSAVTDEVTTLDVNAVFVAVGCVPSNGRFSDTVSLSSTGYIRAGEDCRTELEGVFAAGDTREKSIRQIVTAVSDGGVAALAAADYIRSRAY